MSGPKQSSFEIEQQIRARLEAERRRKLAEIRRLEEIKRKKEEERKQRELQLLKVEQEKLRNEYKNLEKMQNTIKTIQSKINKSDSKDEYTLNSINKVLTICKQKVDILTDIPNNKEQVLNKRKIVESNIKEVQKILENELSEEIKILERTSKEFKGFEINQSLNKIKKEEEKKININFSLENEDTRGEEYENKKQDLQAKIQNEKENLQTLPKAIKHYESEYKNLENQINALVEEQDINLKLQEIGYIEEMRQVLKKKQTKELQEIQDKYLEYMGYATIANEEIKKMEDFISLEEIRRTSTKTKRDCRKSR